LETSAWFINFASVVAPWLHSRNASTLIEALEKEAGVDVKGH